MRALVTGSAGFLGRHFVQHLVAAGYDVETADIAHTHGKLDCRELFAMIPACHYDLVIHCAAVVGGRETIENDPLAMVGNLELDAAMFRWAVKSPPGCVVYLSSSAAYPVQYQTGAGWNLDEYLIDLDAASEPDALYGWIKLTGERLAREARRRGIRVITLRPFSGYGWDQDDTYPFPAMIDRALRRDDPFIIWGDGTQVRDFVHVDDIVGATLTLIDKGYNAAINIGTGLGYSMWDLALLIAEKAGYEPCIQTLPDKPQGVHYRVCDPGLLSEFYKPLVTLEEGVREALERRA